MTRVSVAAANSRASLWGSQAQSLQYRVLVADTDEQVQNQVQALVPDAFSTSLQGQSALQIGAFSSYENAQEAVQILSQNGLRGIIQPVE
jgi:cell division septation protein DedD